MVKVIEVSYNYPAEVFIERHLQALWATGLSVQAVARHRTENYSAIASVGSRVTGGVPVQVMPNFDHLTLSGRLSSLRYLLTAKQFPSVTDPLRDQVLLAFFRNLKPDLIHFHATGLAAMMRWIPEKLGIPYTVSLRGSDVQVFPLRSPREAQEASDALLGAKRVHTVCRNLGEVAERLIGTSLKFDTIYTTVPVPDTLSSYTSDDTAGLHFVSVGRLHWRKAFHALLIALRVLLDRGIVARLTIVGNGPDESRLRYWIKRLDLSSCVTLTGKLGSDDIRSLLNSAHAYVQSSVAEGFSNAVAEAMAWGCPVFATDVGGTAEIIRDGENGFLLSPRNPESWADKLELARNAKLMNRVRAQGYETARQCFSPQVHAEAFARFYERALEKKKTNGNAVREHTPLIEHTRPSEFLSTKHTVVIVGQLNWAGGADQILRALASIVRPNQTRIVLVGEGEQADELRYLAQYLDFPALEIFPGSSLENVLANQEHQPNAVVRLPEDVRGCWTITYCNERKSQVPFGDCDKLVEALRQVFETSEVCKTSEVCER